MIPLIPAVISAIPALINLFTGEKSRTESVIELANKAGQALGIGGASPDEVIAHLQNNPDAVIKLKQIELEAKKEDNRHEELPMVMNIQDKQNARGSEHLSDMQTDIASKIYTQSSYTIPLLLVMNVAVVVITNYVTLDTTVVVAVSNLIGIAMNNSYRERQSVLEFLFGSSVGSKIKDLTSGGK